ncbi:Mov34/MPN/PAD-1 family protein, partial [Halobium palmae]
YELDPEAALEAIERVESSGRDVVGFYHSHPRGPLEPSATDRARATWPGYVYCIVVPGGESGTSSEGVRAWRWTGEAFESLDVEVPND